MRVVDHGPCEAAEDGGPGAGTDQLRHAAVERRQRPAAHGDDVGTQEARQGPRRRPRADVESGGQVHDGDAGLVIENEEKRAIEWAEVYSQRAAWRHRRPPSPRIRWSSSMVP